MKRLAWMAGGLMLLAGPAFAHQQNRQTTESRSQEQMNDQRRQEQTTQPAQPGQQPSATTPSETQKPSEMGTEQGTTGTSKAPVSGKEMTQGADEPKKALTAVELYTKNALDNAKVLYEAAQMPQGPSDRMMFKEISSNISRDIQKADQNLTKFQNLAKAAPGKEDVAAKRDQVKSSLKEARQANAKLSTMKDRSQMADQASTVYTALKSANDSLMDIETAYDVTSIDKITPSEKAPVRGTEQPSTTPPSQMNQPSPETQPPSTTTPMTPEKGKSSTQPKSPSDD